ncbi:MAG: glutamine amidotransferase [Pirellulaceae bacterium]|nr:glutamine amidotransferase [Pirellulaceae bacterium]
MTHIVWGSPDWILPTASIAVILIAVVVWSYYRAAAHGTVRAVAAGLKIIAILAISLCLLEPLVSGTRPRPQANVIALLIDDSESMLIDKRGIPEDDLINRWLADQNQAWRTRLEQDFDLRSYAFDRQLRRLDPQTPLEFQGNSSRLGRALQSLQERFLGRPIAGAILISDGNATEATPIDCSEITFPIFPVIESDAPVAADIRIEDVQISQTNFETSPTTVTAKVASEGHGRTRATVELLTPNGQVLEEQSFDLAADQSDNTVRFRFRPDESGLTFYKLNVFAESERERKLQAPSKLEATVKNNTRTIMINRGGGPYRVLYVSGRPNWEFKFLRRALQEDDEISLVGLLRIANKEPKFAFRDTQGTGDTNRLFEGFDNRDAEDAETYNQPVMVRLGIEDESELRDGFPQSAEELFAYHALVIDDLESSFFSPDQLLLIRRYVSQRGGGLLMLGGPSSFHLGNYQRTPLEELLPVYLAPKSRRTEESVSLNLTREGWLEPWIRLRATEREEEKRLESMPEFLTLNPSGKAKPGASVIATASNQTGDPAPAIATQRFGKGRTASALIGDFWRWSMQRKESDPDDLAVFWRQTMRWLTADGPRRVELEAVASDDGESITLNTTVRDEEFAAEDGATVKLTIEEPNNNKFQLDAEADPSRPGLYTSRYWPAQSGGYRVTAEVEAPDGSPIAKRVGGWSTETSVREFSRIQPNLEQLEQIANDTGGEVIRPKQLERFVKSLSRRKVPVTEPWVYPLWHQPFIFGLAILCLCTEWGLRRWKGLA